MNEEYERLVKKLSLLETTHAKQFAGNVNEGNYQDSCNRIKSVYQQLETVSNALGKPVPVRF